MNVHFECISPITNVSYRGSSLAALGAGDVLRFGVETLKTTCVFKLQPAPQELLVAASIFAGLTLHKAIATDLMDDG